MREGRGGGGRRDAAWSKLSWLGSVASCDSLAIWQAGRRAGKVWLQLSLLVERANWDQIAPRAPRDPLLPDAADLSSRAGERDRKRASRLCIKVGRRKVAIPDPDRGVLSLSLSSPPFLLQCIPYHTSQPSPMQQIPHPRLRWSGQAGRRPGRQSGWRAVIFPHYSVC